ncbi:uncharacterized protein LOC104455407 isoform X4 [Eucalyptus grandis]|uniref:uncharacterized protein LOC104455407 isoform X4 n=1 Tax=Eucalyptus grandis TaxID=71139 RepID=UPI00192EE1F8|nr:uncharacterized protein LOC104455407 isoform X4 [Eucalyptus grandis]
MAAVIGSMEFLVTQIMLVLQQAVDGFGFSPTEEQLINHLKSEEPGWRGGFCVIPTLENINDLDPWDLPARFLEKSVIPSNDREWWFICPQTPKARITRKTPCGYSWKLTGARTSINSGGQVKGHKRILTFQNGKGDWIIHEYHLIDEGGTKIQPMNPEGMESPGLYTFSLPRLLNLLQRELESFSTHQFTNNGGPRVPNADLSYANVQNGEGPDKSIELKWADSLINENPSDTEVQTGEEPRLEKVQQETAARNIEPCISSDEAAARAKNGQISTMKDCPSKLEPLDCAASLEETEGIKQSTFNNSHLSENCRFSPSLDDAAQAKNGQISTMKDCRSKLEPLDWVASLEETEGVKQSSFNSSHLSENRRFSRSLEDAAQAKGLEHEEHKLAGNSPKRRRLEVSD